MKVPEAPAGRYGRQASRFLGLAFWQRCSGHNDVN